jgi:C4-dicarboxylate-specific signal transduction histidine kinase
MVENDVRVQGMLISPELEGNLPQIAGDQIQLQQVILNLIKNAIDALALLGPARMKAIRVVTTRGSNSSVSILVQDNGPGINPESEANIFDPFFTTKSSGMGLGLSISRRIIEDHGGSLRLTETTSKGCTFEIALPV